VTGRQRVDPDAQRIIPLATPADDRQCDALVEGLLQGGIPVVEIALRADSALPAIARIAGRGDVAGGAGTVLGVDQAQRAVDHGASFLVTPGLDEAVVGWALDAGVPIVPGVMTPSEIQAARRLGLRRLKLFPAGLLGGTRALDAYGAVFRDVRFMPSGGVTQDTLRAHLAHPAVFAVSGSWMTNTAMLTAGADAVARAAAAARGILHDVDTA
jgi:2-dehydro-3-deoxyphosphogluconate aldolase/(4S)-4-hydroxy-2-oxoglutarate aldolase